KKRDINKSKATRVRHKIKLKPHKVKDKRLMENKIIKQEEQNDRQQTIRNSNNQRQVI
ncbi:hypothetical protein LCGC14_2312210, partial [marine sediment metagenome]